MHVHPFEARTMLKSHAAPLSPGKVARAALRLKPKDRAALIRRLLASLEPESDPGAEAAWEEEIARRVKEVKSGKAKMVPWSEVRRKMLEIERRAR